MHNPVTWDDLKAMVEFLLDTLRKARSCGYHCSVAILSLGKRHVTRLGKNFRLYDITTYWFHYLCNITILLDEQEV
jgi:hypothetical protein